MTQTKEIYKSRRQTRERTPRDTQLNLRHCFSSIVPPGLSKTGPVWVIQILLEGMNKQMKLVTCGQQSPVFILELVEERHPIAKIQDVSDAHHIQILKINFHGCGCCLCILFKRFGRIFISSFQKFLLFFFQLLLFGFRFLCCGGFSLAWISVFCLSLSPLLQQIDRHEAKGQISATSDESQTANPPKRAPNDLWTCGYWQLVFIPPQCHTPPFSWMVFCHFGQESLKAAPGCKSCRICPQRFEAQTIRTSGTEWFSCLAGLTPTFPISSFNP